jgi:hypothetical protein
MAGIAFRHLLSRWTVTSAMSKAAANNLRQVNYLNHRLF